MGGYFLDAGHIWGKPDGLSECIDVGPRNLGRLGLRIAKSLLFDPFPTTKFLTGEALDFKALYTIPHSGVRFYLFDNGTAGWFEAYDLVIEWCSGSSMILMPANT